MKYAHYNQYTAEDRHTYLRRANEALDAAQLLLSSGPNG